MNDTDVITIIRNFSNQNKEICQHLISLQLQIQALVTVLPKDKQDEWMMVLDTLANKQGVNSITGEPLQKV